MAINKPERIWITKHKPNNEPKFHIAVNLEGEGREIKADSKIFNIGWVFKKDFNY